MLNHLIELRRRALFMTLFFGALFLICFFYANSLFLVITGPLIHVLPQQSSLIATKITSPVLTPIKLAADIALLLTLPFALIQLWLFISPGLYRSERQPALGFMLTSLTLFVFGLLFCFFVILPFMFQFFVQAAPADVRLMPDINDAISFITRMLMIFGICFQVPLLCMLLVRMRWIDISVLKQFRSYFIVFAFIIGMLLTPPDVLSQIMLAVPLCLLYELGIILAAWQVKKNATTREELHSNNDEKQQPNLKL